MLEWPAGWKRVRMLWKELREAEPAQLRRPASARPHAALDARDLFHSSSWLGIAHRSCDPAHAQVWLALSAKRSEGGMKNRPQAKPRLQPEAEEVCGNDDPVMLHGLCTCSTLWETGNWAKAAGARRRYRGCRLRRPRRFASARGGVCSHLPGRPAQASRRVGWQGTRPRRRGLTSTKSALGKAYGNRSWTVRQHAIVELQKATGCAHQRGSGTVISDLAYVLCSGCTEASMWQFSFSSPLRRFLPEARNSELALGVANYGRHESLPRGCRRRSLRNRGSLLRRSSSRMCFSGTHHQPC